MSIERFCKDLSITCVAEYGGAETPEGFPAGSHSYRVTLRRRNPRRQMTVPFHMGPALCREPDAPEVLECLISEAMSVECARGFEDWASDLGYDTDSRKAEATYRACVAIADKLKRFLGDDLDAAADAISG